MQHRLIELPLRADPRGSLVFAQEGDHIPFPVKRVFYIYDIPAGTRRAGHAHREQHQLLVMLRGACRVHVEDASGRASVLLDSPRTALYAPPLRWLDLDGFSAGSVCLVLTSDLYDERDYVRDHAEFKQLMAARGDSSSR